MGLVPANRAQQGAVLRMNVRENLTLAGLQSVQRRFGWIPAALNGQKPLDGHVPLTYDRPIRNGRWPNFPVETNRRLCWPSGCGQCRTSSCWMSQHAGVDVGAKVSIYELIRDAASQGTAVVISSSDTKELAEVLRSGCRAEWRS